MSEDAAAVLARMNAMMNGGVYTPPPAAAAPVYQPPAPVYQPPAASAPAPAAPAYQPPAAAAPPAAAPPAAEKPAVSSFKSVARGPTRAELEAIYSRAPGDPQKEAFYVKLGVQPAEAKRLVARITSYEQVKVLREKTQQQIEDEVA